MYGNSVEVCDAPGNPYPHIAAGLEEELKKERRKVAELQGRMQYAFESEEALISSAFFQRALSKSLAFKDRQIRELQEEIMKIAAQRALAQKGHA